MPTYEYECLHCHHKFEAFQSITAKPLNKCPKCAKGVKRLISSGAGFIFKGSGFYATDYKKSKTSSHIPNAATCPKAKKDGCDSCPHQGK